MLEWCRESELSCLTPISGAVLFDFMNNTSGLFSKKRIQKKQRFRMTAMEICSDAKVYTKVPDGGWGWVVAVAFFFVEVFTYGVIKSFGVFFKELMVYFDESNSRVSWIISICVFVITFTAPLSTVLSNYFGHRPVVMTGGLLISLGMVTGSFARSVDEMYWTIGLISGLGFCLSFLPTVTLLSQYFDKKRSLVTAVASTGECFAMFAFAPAITAMKDHIGWRHSLLIVGLLQLHVVVCGSLLRPMRIQKELEDTEKQTVETSYILENENMLTSIDSIDSGVEITTSPQRVNENVKSENENAHEDAKMLEEARNPGKNPKIHLLDFSILKDYSFICYALFGLFATLAFFAPSLYIIPMSMSLGIDNDRSAYMLSTMAIAEVFGRIGAGCILNKKPIRKIYIELIFAILLCVALIAFPFATEFWGLITCSAFFGCMLGTVAGTHIPMLADDDVVGIEKMSSAVGVYIFIQSIAALAGPPLGGALVDATNSYGSAFYACAAGMALAAICLALVRPYKTGLRKNKANQAREEAAVNEKEHFEEGPDDFLDMDFGKQDGAIKSAENNA